MLPHLMGIAKDSNQTHQWTMETNIVFQIIELLLRFYVAGGCCLELRGGNSWGVSATMLGDRFSISLVDCSDPRILREFDWLLI